VMSTYGLHDNPEKCQSFAHDKLLSKRGSTLPPSKWRTPDDKMSLCERCKNKWQKDNWPLKCVPYPPADQQEGGA
jgi:hypothetical protein